jgi:hypothetical protein
VKITKKTTRAELGAMVCQALAAVDDEPVLVGGAVVSIYSRGRYVSDDLDFVSWLDERRRRPAMEALGFAKRGAYCRRSTACSIAWRGTSIAATPRRWRRRSTWRAPTASRFRPSKRGSPAKAGPPTARR